LAEEKVYPSVVVFTGGKPGLSAAKAVVAAHIQSNTATDHLPAPPNVVYVSVVDYEGYFALMKASTRFPPLPLTVLTQRPSSKGSATMLARTFYLYAEANNETHRTQIARDWAAGEDADKSKYGYGIDKLLAALPDLSGTATGDSFVDSGNPITKVPAAALTMLLVNRYSTVADIVWDLTATLTTNRKPQLPTLPAAVLALGRQYVGVADNMFIPELCCQTMEYLQNECGPYFDGFWTTPPADGRGTEFYQANAIVTLVAQQLAGCNLEWLMHFVVPQAAAHKFIRDSLQVRASNIQGAGEGLFALQDFNDGDLLCEFPGCWVPTSALRANAGIGSMKDHYQFVVEGNTMLSYMTHPCQANKINSATINEKLCGTQNVRLEQLALAPPDNYDKEGAETQALIRVYADGPIKVGAELLANYGPSYFSNVRY
tara:strand:- start:222 stop:1511 length:1290 start_codon:yes stop_codon:yes gene_type:complete